MLFRIILLLSLIGLYFYCRNRLRSTAPPQRKSLLLKWLLWAAIAGVVAMAATGRLHWLGGLLALSVPLLRQLSLSLIQRFYKRPSGSADEQHTVTPPPSNADSLTRLDAIKLLNLDDNFSQQELIQAHRRMMQKNHPDQGGSDYLAALINKARDLLLEKFDS